MHLFFADIFVPDLGISHEYNRPAARAHSPDSFEVDDLSRPRNEANPIRLAKFRLSPTINVPILNCRTSPLQYQQGASVVTMMAIAVGALTASLAEGVGLPMRRRDRHAGRAGYGLSRAAVHRHERAPPQWGYRPPPARCVLHGRRRQVFQSGVRGDPRFRRGFLLLLISRLGRS